MRSSANDNHRTWIEGLADRHPWRIALVSFALSVLAGMLLFSRLDIFTR